MSKLPRVAVLGVLLVPSDRNLSVCLKKEISSSLP